MTMPQIIEKYKRHEKDVGSPELRLITLIFKNMAIKDHFFNGLKKDRLAFSHYVKNDKKVRSLKLYVKKKDPKKLDLILQDIDHVRNLLKKIRNKK